MSPVRRIDDLVAGGSLNRTRSAMGQSDPEVCVR